MIKTAAIPMDKEIQSFQFIFTGQQYFFFSFRRKIEEYKNPHNSIFAKSVKISHNGYISGKLTWRISPAKHL